METDLGHESKNDTSRVLLGTSSPQITMSGTEIRPKEAVLVMLALALMVFSMALFYKHWSKNYRDINSLPYYAYLYKVRRCTFNLKFHEKQFGLSRLQKVIVLIYVFIILPNSYILAQTDLKILSLVT